MMLSDLADSWRARANELEPYSPPGAVAWRAAAEELEQALREEADQLLTLSGAAAVSGYSERRLRELIADGAIPQAGRKGAPRIRRGDLPVRPGRRSEPVISAYNPATDADTLVGRMP